MSSSLNIHVTYINKHILGIMHGSKNCGIYIMEELGYLVTHAESFRLSVNATDSRFVWVWFEWRQGLRRRDAFVQRQLRHCVHAVIPVIDSGEG